VRQRPPSSTAARLTGPRSPPSATSLLLASAVALATFAAACVTPREIERQGGVHPDGFIEPAAPQYHGTFLREHGYPLGDCRQCHGDDYGGGVVGTSCNTSGCHTSGVEWCGTCHGGKAPPEPTTGSHATHPGDCADCHTVPTDARAHDHPNGNVEVTLSGLATAGPSTPAWSAADGRCVNTYCHGAESPRWDEPTGPLACDACHAAPPPESHARFAVAAAPEGCTGCHPAAAAPEHMNGTLDYAEPTCNACHGKAPTGAPPPALDGSTAATSRGVGAHRRHLDETLGDRIGRVVACDACHEIPTSMRAEGHLDSAAPADVQLWGGSYDPVSASCAVGCHWDHTPGPVWTDSTGAARACDACHGFPPTKTRAGTPHPLVEPALAACQACHHFETASHVDGHVDLLP